MKLFGGPRLAARDLRPLGWPSLITSIFSPRAIFCCHFVVHLAVRCVTYKITMTLRRFMLRDVLLWAGDQRLRLKLAKILEFFCLLLVGQRNSFYEFILCLRRRVKPTVLGGYLTRNNVSLQLRWLVVRLSLSRTGFEPMSFRVAFFDKVVLRQIFLSEYIVFSCQCNCTPALYSLTLSSARWTEAAVPHRPTVTLSLQ